MFPTAHGVVSQGVQGAEPAPTPGIVSYVAGGDANPVTATSINLPLSSAIQAGDLILVTVWARSAINTPAGYALEHTGPLGVFGGRLAVFSRVATGAEAATTLTISWASSGRGGAAHLVARGTAGTPAVTAIDSTGPDTTPPFEIPTLPNDREGRLGVAVYGSEYAATSGSAPAIAPPSGYSLASTASRLQNRHALAYKALDPSEDVTGHFSNGLSSPHDVTLASLMLQSGA